MLTSEPHRISIKCDGQYAARIVTCRRTALLDFQRGVEHKRDLAVGEVHEYMYVSKHVIYATVATTFADRCDLAENDMTL